jgi:hypothetical protein
MRPAESEESPDVLKLWPIEKFLSLNTEKTGEVLSRVHGTERDSLDLTKVSTCSALTL